MTFAPSALTPMRKLADVWEPLVAPFQHTRSMSSSSSTAERTGPLAPRPTSNAVVHSRRDEDPQRVGPIVGEPAIAVNAVPPTPPGAAGQRPSRTSANLAPAPIDAKGSISLDRAGGRPQVFHVVDPATIEAFVRSDPYVTDGLVTRLWFRAWNVAVVGDA